MQRPTLVNVRIRSTRDALHVFNAVARGVLPLITRRLDVDERRAIVAGNVYVWEERGANTETIGIGMERWTDGMAWGPSRVRDEFLYYNQKDFDDEDGAFSSPWSPLQKKRQEPAKAVRPGNTSSTRSGVDRLIKQTYSVHVSLPADRPRGIVRKWHLTAYFSQEKLDTLTTVDLIRGVGDVMVPEGLFRSARAGKGRRDIREMTSIHPEVPLRPALVVDTRSGRDESRTPNLALHQTMSPAGYPTSLPPPTQPQPQHSQLVPLEYLQNISVPRRYPMDEQLLRRFAAFNTHSPGS